MFNLISRVMLNTTFGLSMACRVKEKTEQMPDVTLKDRLRNDFMGLDLGAAIEQPLVYGGFPENSNIRVLTTDCSDYTEIFRETCPIQKDAIVSDFRGWHP